MWRSVIIFAVLLVQIGCAYFFVGDIFSSVFGFRSTPISWRAREFIEIGAAVGLMLGVLMGGLMLRRMQRAQLQAEERLRRASSAFMDVLEERFSQWSLTPAERDVALFAIKGMSTGEIAALRSTSEGTVKAQTNAIYRKAGVSGRAQLLAAFIDDLVELPANA
ncbi:MAG: DNA-binding CsgD family transcriptional regulator [Halocynthiibacter sp.]|jgi:DNA-binding CsgD family transcriptional regulator